jgi:hypothetical protein
VVSSTWASLALASSEALRACSAAKRAAFSLAKALAAIDQADFSLDSASYAAASCAARTVVRYSQESVKSVRGLK